MGNKPYQMEIVGVAASGKSSLVSALLDARDEIVQAWRFRRPAVAPAIVQAGLRDLPGWAALYSGMSPIDAVHRRLLFTMAVQHELQRLASGPGGRVNLIDQGPVYALARIRFDGGNLQASPAARRLLRHCTRVWAEHLDCIVHLDASDDVLYARLHSREQSHRIEGQDKHQAYAFYDRYRRAYQETIDELCSLSQIKLLRLQSHELSVSECSERVLSTLDRR